MVAGEGLACLPAHAKGMTLFAASGTNPGFAAFDKLKFMSAPQSEPCSFCIHRPADESGH